MSMRSSVKCLHESVSNDRNVSMNISHDECVNVSLGGGTRTVITKKTESTSHSGFGGVQYGKPAGQYHVALSHVVT